MGRVERREAASLPSVLFRIYIRHTLGTPGIYHTRTESCLCYILEYGDRIYIMSRPGLISDAFLEAIQIQSCQTEAETGIACKTDSREAGSGTELSHSPFFSKAPVDQMSS